MAILGGCRWADKDDSRPLVFKHAVATLPAMRTFARFALASVALLTIAFAGSASAHEPLLVGAVDGIGGGARTSFAVVGFSEDGTRALLQQKHVAGPLVATSFLVVDAQGRSFDVLISQRTQVAAGSVEGIDNGTCRDRVKMLEAALVGFRSVKARLGQCARPTRADVVVAPQKTTPAALTISDELKDLQLEIGVHDGLFFVNEDGPLVVVLQADRLDNFGDSVVVKTFLRTDPRLNDRWPTP